MTPVFANSAFVHVRERLVLRGGQWTKIALKVRFGILRHPTAGVVLIDTGYTEDVVTGSHRSLALRLYAGALRPDLVSKGQPSAVLARMGLETADVSAVIITHFHPDHISGLRQFPNARFIVCGDTVNSLKRMSKFSKTAHGVFEELLPHDFHERLDPIQEQPLASYPIGELPAGHDLLGDGSAITVALPGHAQGQFGLCFTKLDRPLLYAVDAQWMPAALNQGRAPGFPSSIIADDRRALQASTQIVRNFAKNVGDVVLCHDPAETQFDLAP